MAARRLSKDFIWIFWQSALIHCIMKLMCYKEKDLKWTMMAGTTTALKESTTMWSLTTQTKSRTSWRRKTKDSTSSSRKRKKPSRKFRRHSIRTSKDTRFSRNIWRMLNKNSCTLKAWSMLKTRKHSHRTIWSRSPRDKSVGLSPKWRSCKNRHWSFKRGSTTPNKDPQLLVKSVSNWNCNLIGTKKSLSCGQSQVNKKNKTMWRCRSLERRTMLRSSSWIFKSRSWLCKLVESKQT